MSGHYNDIHEISHFECGPCNEHKQSKDQHGKKSTCLLCEPFESFEPFEHFEPFEPFKPFEPFEGLGLRLGLGYGLGLGLG